MEIKLNLLSEAKKNEVRKKKRYRLIVWQESVVVALALFYVGVLFGISSMLDLQVKSQEGVVATNGKEQIFQEISDIERKFEDTNKKVAETMKFQQEHMAWSGLFAALDATVPEGVLLEKMSTVNRKVSLSGKSDTRETLLKFQDKLNGSDCFENAKVPLADLFAQENIDFLMDVDMKQTCLKPKNI